MATRGKPLKPGKTAPRLVADLLDYDPRYSLRNGKNLLADPAPKYRGVHSPRKGPGDCRHILMRKDGQTQAPTSLDEQPDGSTNYVVATYCTRCRCHFEISVDFRQQQEGQFPCKLSDDKNPMHHLQLVESIYPQSSGSPGFKSQDLGQEEQHRFVCSGASCPVIVSIKALRPRLSKQLLLLFNDVDKLKARGEQVKKVDPGRYEGLEPLKPVQVLSNIRAYLKDAKEQAPSDNTTDLKRIAKRNKKYVLAFADECDDLFNYLGFTTIKENGLDDEASYFWQLPIVSGDNGNFIDDVMVELEVLISERTPQEMRMVRAPFIHSPISAMKDMERSLGYFGFQTRSRHVDLTHVEHPYYASLGAVDSFTDNILSWAYNRQRRCDPQNKPYYLDCLQDLAKGRGSYDLEMTVVEAKSLGEYGLQEIEEAYKLLNLNPNTIEGDDHIIGIYRSRIEAAPRQKDEARRCLKIIGEARNSDKIKDIANDTAMSFKEACEFLEVPEGMDDMEMIFSVAIGRAAEGTSRGLLGQALRAIGKHKSDWGLLRRARGLQGNMEFDEAVGEAYAQLQISDRTCSDDTVLQYYMHVRDNATDQSRRNAYKDAACTIAEQRESLFLMRKADDPNAVVEPTPSTADQPVGLANIGNTCYLNSLLQFLYTINSIREVVTNFDKYRIDLQGPNADEDIKNRLPNGLSVQKMEVVKAQKFVIELQRLFEQMRQASTQSVAPTKQLVELTLFSNAAEAGWEAERQRKQSISTNLPNMANLLQQNRPIQAPEGPSPKIPSSRSETNNPSPNPPSSATFDEDIVMVDKPEVNNDGDNTSESTLVGEELPPYDEPQREVLESSPASDEIKRPKQAEAEETDACSHVEDAVMVNGMTHEDAQPTAALETPPPVPPRNKSGLSIQTNGNGSSTAIDAEKISFGTQQDVTEVIGNVVWRLQCAIKATSIEDGSGVQQDPVGDTLNGSTKVYSRKPTGWEVKIDPWKALFAYPVTPPLTGVRDIYEALDASLDLQKVGNLLQYRSIVKLPPILQIQIQRTHFDKVTGEGKNDNVVEFPETIFLDRYMDSDDPALKKRRHDAWNWKNKLSKMEARKAVLKSTDLTGAGFDIPDALKATQKYVRELEEADIDGVKVSPALTEALEGRIAEVNTEVRRLEEEIASLKKKLNDQFTDMRKYEYQLRAVFIHRGQIGGGHYWIYLYDAKNDIWRKYNDEHVSRVVDRNRVFSPQNFDDGTPYFLGYVRSSAAKDLMNAVVRDVEPKSTQMDVIMGDSEDAPAASASVRHVEFATPKPIAPKELPGWTSPGIVRPPPRYPSQLWSDTPAMKDANGNDWEL